MEDKKQIKAVMLDVDGTLMADHRNILPYTATMLRRLHEKGILIGIATGRDVANIDDLCDQWGIADIVDVIIGSGGAEISDKILGTKVYQYPLPGSLILSVIHHFEDMDVNFAIPFNGVLYAPKDDELLWDLAEADGMPYKIVDFDEFCADPRPKVMIVCKVGDMDKVVMRSQTFSDPDCRMASLVTSKRLYEYMDPRVSKTNGIAQAMSEHGIAMDEICAFGDQDNDCEMIKACGMGVAMGNGSEMTKEAADYITDDNRNDGIGKFISEYLLKDDEI